MHYSNWKKDEINEWLQEELKTFNEIKEQKLKVDMSRGKPGAEQLDKVMSFFEYLSAETVLASEADVRNYGELCGIPEMRSLFAEILGLEAENVIAAGSSSLNLMYDTVQRAMQFGIMGEKPWNQLERVKFICPVPGYDRHFAVTEHFGIEMIAVPMDEYGPDMDIIESYVESDPSIKGMWCVPKYSNPTGVTFSDSVVDRLATMQPAAKDFRIFWDNAYAVHDLGEQGDSLKNILKTAKEHGHEDHIFMFTSTSKITFPGSGVACFAASENNIKDAIKHYQYQTICPNKINQLAHVKFMRDLAHVKEIMQIHAEVLRPKFQMVLDHLEPLKGTGIAEWTNPSGGYFISLNVLSGCARETVALCKELGLTLTAAGATFPLGMDDTDRNIRIAPTYPGLSELEQCCKILVCCVKIATYRKLLELAQ